MFGPAHYVPILRGKMAELQALGETSGKSREVMTPLIELPPIAGEAEGDYSGRTDPSLEKIGTKVERRWGTDQRFFYELGLVPSDPAVGGGVHPVEFVFGDAREKGLLAVPVTSPGRDDEFQSAIASALAQDGRGVCVRISGEDFDDVETAIAETDDLLMEFGIGRDEADLILDFAEVSADQTGPMVLAAVAVINSIPNVDAWRSLTWAGTAFPAVQGFRPRTINTADRAEWQIWQSIQARRSLPRLPSFADYTVNGVQSDYDVSAAVFQSSPNLRYTAEDDFIIWKARHPRHGHDQFNEICDSAVTRVEFRGSEFSEGDAYIQRCADREDGPGNAVKWRQAGVNHHLAVVADQIASLLAPSAGA